MNLSFVTTALAAFLILLGPVSCTKNNQDPGDSINLDKVNLNDHLVAHWLYNETETIAKDNSENKFNGKIFGSPEKYRGFTTAYNFDGKNDFIAVPDTNNAPPQQISSLTKGSISIWFKVDSIPVVDGIMPVFYYGSSDNCLNMFDASNQGLIIEVGHSPVHLGSKRLYFTLFMNGCTLPSLCFDTDFFLDENSWYHFVAVVGDNYNTGYLNGKELTGRHYNFGNDSTSEFFSDATAHEALYLGKGYWDTRTVFFKGQIDDVRIYNKDINRDEVKYLFSKRSAGTKYVE